jgi:hypothetical protein
MRSPCCVCVCPFQSLNLLTNFHEIFYECYAIGGYRSLIVVNFLQSVMTTFFIDGSNTGATIQDCVFPKICNFFKQRKSSMKSVFGIQFDDDN